MANDPQLTNGEKAQVAWYVARMCKRQLAGDRVHQADLQRKVDRILDQARKRDAKSK